MLSINETFLSIQGEGYYAGTPAFFVRLQGCDVNCPFCDTQRAIPIKNNEAYKQINLYYEHRLSDSFVETEKFSRSLVQFLIDHPNINYIIITGGEPLLQKENIGDLIFITCKIMEEQVGEIRSKRLHFGIETNGHNSIYDCRIKPNLLNQVSITISPKLRNGNPNYMHLDYQIIANSGEHAFKRFSLKLLYSFYDIYGQIYNDLHFDDYFVQPLRFEDDTPHIIQEVHKKTIRELNKISDKWRLSVQLQKLLNLR